MPGLVDTHVHVNEPGRTEWEGFETATRAAAAGGVTTILDMPLNSIPATTTVDALEAKRDAARGKCLVDVGFIGGVVPGNVGELERAGTRGVLRLQVLSRRRRAWTSSRTSTEARSARGVAGARASSAAAAWCTPSSRRSSSRRRRLDAIAQLRDVPRVASAARRSTSAIELLDRADARVSRRRVHIVHLSSARVARRSFARRARGVAAHRRDVSALSHVRGGGDPRRRDRVQVRAADSRARRTRGACGQALDRRRRSISSRPTIRRVRPR